MSYDPEKFEMEIVSQVQERASDVLDLFEIEVDRITIRVPALTEDGLNTIRVAWDAWTKEKNPRRVGFVIEYIRGVAVENSYVLRTIARALLNELHPTWSYVSDAESLWHVDNGVMGLMNAAVLKWFFLEITSEYDVEDKLPPREKLYKRLEIHKLIRSIYDEVYGKVKETYAEGRKNGA